MPFLKLNGIEVQVSSTAGATIERVKLGEYGRTANHSARSFVNATSADYKLTSIFYSLAEASAVQKVISGSGHTWSFETSDAVSSRGLLPSYVGPGVTSGSAAGQYGFGLSMPNLKIVQWAVGFSGPWTAMFWRTTSAGTFHQIVRVPAVGSAHEAFEDGVRNDFAYTGMVHINPSTGDLQVTATDGDMVLDDLVLFPFSVSDSSVAALYALHSAQAFPALPYVLAEGDLFPTATEVLGEVGNGKVVQWVGGGSLVTGEAFEFTLRKRTAL